MLLVGNNRFLVGLYNSLLLYHHLPVHIYQCALGPDGQASVFYADGS